MKLKIGLIAFGVLAALLLVEAGLRVAAYFFSEAYQADDVVPVQEGDHYTILCLGESTTAGAFSHGEPYPARLEKLLNARDPGIKFKVINKGLVGATSSVMLSKLDGFLGTYNPQMVVVMLGINDDLVMYENDNAAYRDETPVDSEPFYDKLRVVKLARYLWAGLAGGENGSIEQMKYDEQPGNYSLGQMYKDMTSDEHMQDVPDGYHLGRCYVEQGKYGQATEVFNEILAREPGDDNAYLQLGRIQLYHFFDDQAASLQQASKMFSKAIELNPDNYSAHVYLALCLQLQGKLEESIGEYQRAIRIDPQEGKAFFFLSTVYSGQGRNAESKKILITAIESGTQNKYPYLELAKHYWKDGEYDKVEALFSKALDAGIRDDKLFGGMAVYYEKQGKHELANKYFQEAHRMRLARYKPHTRYHYNLLKSRILGRRIRFVAVQYPMRSVTPLKKLLRPHAGVLFVDNENTFKEAVRAEGYDRLFTDNFAGDFGHCTAKGNQLLAENIANVIQRAVCIK